MTVQLSNGIIKSYDPEGSVSEKRGWLSMRMKEKKVLLFLALMFLCICSPMRAEARAGGASGSSSGGGGGFSSGGSSYYSSHSNRTGRSSSPVSSVVMFGGFFLMANAGVVLFFVKSRRASSKSYREMRQYQQFGDNWDINEIQEQVKNAYFVIQECWKRQDPDYAKDYMSQKCYDDFVMKLGWMQVRNEVPVQKNERLLSAVPVHTFDDLGKDQDYIWYLIHGKMIDYVMDEKTGRMIRGSRKNEAFYEYWKFIHLNGHWVLDEIRQKDEMDIDEFANS